MENSGTYQESNQTGTEDHPCVEDQILDNAKHLSVQEESSSAQDSGVGDVSSVGEGNSEKKSKSPCRNTPPELIPYCSDVHVVEPDPDSSPPRLLPEDKMSETLPTVLVKDSELSGTLQTKETEIGSSPIRTLADLECILLDDLSDEDSNEYIVTEPSDSVRHRKWRNDTTADAYGLSKKLYSGLFVSKGKPKLKERDKLRKASERMMRSPRALIPTSGEACRKYKALDSNNIQSQDSATLNGDCIIVSSSASSVTARQPKTVTVGKVWSPQNKNERTGNILNTFSGGGMPKTCLREYKKSKSSTETLMSDNPKEVGNKMLPLSIRNIVHESDSSTPKRDNKEIRIGDYQHSARHVGTGASFVDVCDTLEPKPKTVTITSNYKFVSKDNDTVFEDRTSQPHQKFVQQKNKMAVSQHNYQFESLLKHKKSYSDTETARDSLIYYTQDSSPFSKKSYHFPDAVSTDDSLIVGTNEPGVKSEIVIDKCGKEGNSSSENMSKAVEFSKSGFVDNEIEKMGEETVPKKRRKVLESPEQENIPLVNISNLSKKNKTIPNIEHIEGSKKDNLSTNTSSNDLQAKFRSNKMDTSNVEITRVILHDAIDKAKHTLHVSESTSEIYKEDSNRQDGLCEGNSFKNDSGIKHIEKQFTVYASVKELKKDKYQKNVSDLNLKENDKSNNKVEDEINFATKGEPLNTDIFSNVLEETNCEKDVDCLSNIPGSETISDSKGKDLHFGCDNSHRSIANSHDDAEVSDYNMTLDTYHWPNIEGDEDEDDDDDFFTVPQRVSTGKEERDVIDGIEILSFETERDMVEFTKIQQDFFYGSSIDDGMIQSDDGFDMMDDTLAYSGDVDLQYVHQAIVPTKTNDITKIKGWRNKQFAVNDNPARCSGPSSDTYEDDDGFESCDVRTADETNIEDDQQNHWYSEDKPNVSDPSTCLKDDRLNQTPEKAHNQMPVLCSSDKQSPSPLKEDVMLNSAAVFRPEAVELLKRLESSVNETKSSKSAFVSDILDNYLSSHSQLNVSYEIPKLGAEEGITHHPELETDQFPFRSPQKLSPAAAEKPRVGRKPGGPKPKTLAEKRKLLEQEMQEAKYKLQRKGIIPQRGRPRLYPPKDSVKASTKFSKHFRGKYKLSSKLKSHPIISNVKDVPNLKEETFHLDPDYKYTWIGKRPIRITGSKVTKTPTVNIEIIKLSDPNSVVPSEEAEQKPTQNSVAFEPSSQTKSEKVKTEEIQTEEERNDKPVTSECTDSQPTNVNPTPEPRIEPLQYGIVVSPGVGYPLHPLAVKQLMKLRSDQFHINQTWAKFAAAVVTSRKKTDDSTKVEKHIIPINDTHHSVDKVLTNSVQGNNISPTEDVKHLKLECSNKESNKLNPLTFEIIKLPSKSESSKITDKVNSASPFILSPDKPSLSHEVKSSKTNTNNVISVTSSCPGLPKESPLDKTECEVKNILEDMIQCVLNHEIENMIIQDDPDTSTCSPLAIPKSPKKAFGKQKKTKVFRELNKIDVNVIVMGDDKKNENIFCDKEFCRLGCVCSSLQGYQSISTSKHCGKAKCMFKCSCENHESCKTLTEQKDDNSVGEKPSLLYCTAIRLQDEGNRHLARVEKEFKHTVIQSNDEVIVLGGSSSGSTGGNNGGGGRRRREIKLPERYRDSSVVLGKEFAMAEFKMITGEDLGNIPPTVSNQNSRRSERQLHLPTYVQVEVPKPATVTSTKLFNKPTKGKLTPEQKISLWCDRYKVKECRVTVERSEGLEDVVPWCMVHFRYDCFCSGQSMKPFKRMSCRTFARPPPVPGPPLDLTESANSKQDADQQTRISRNVAIKSTSSRANIHAHNVDRNSARTNGTTINYLLRNQSQWYKNRHKKICIEESEVPSQMSSYDYSNNLVAQSENSSAISNTASCDYAQPDILSPPPALEEEQFMPTHSDFGEVSATDNADEEVGFGKIVSIMSLRPEEFERCETSDMFDFPSEEMQYDNNYMCNIERTENTEAPLLLPPQTHESTSSNVIEGTQAVREECHSADTLTGNTMFDNSSFLIPVLPEASNDISCVRFAELISRKDSELRNILENGTTPLDLSRTTAGAVQLIGWDILLDQQKNQTYHIWLHYKRGSMAKLLVTDTAVKPDQYCTSLHDYKLSSPPDFHNKLPPLVTFLVEQLLVKNEKLSHNKEVDIVSKSTNCFGLLQCDGVHWELVGSLVKSAKDYSVGEIQNASNYSHKIQARQLSDLQNSSENQQQDRRSVEKCQKKIFEVTSIEQNYISNKSEDKVGEMTERETVKLFSKPLKLQNLKENSLKFKTNIDISTQQMGTSKRHSDKGKVVSAGCSVLRKSIDVPVDSGKPSASQSTSSVIPNVVISSVRKVTEESFRKLGKTENVTEIIEDVTMSSNYISTTKDCSQDAFDTNRNTVVEKDQMTSIAIRPQGSSVPETRTVAEPNFSLQNDKDSSICTSNANVSEEHFQNNAISKQYGSKETSNSGHMVMKTVQNNLVSEKTSESPNFGPTKENIQSLIVNNSSALVPGVEVPLPIGTQPARWYMLNIKYHFDLLYLISTKCVIRYGHLNRAVSLANNHRKTVRVPIERKCQEKVQVIDSYQPKFGIYSVPDLYTRVFIGPYGLREEAGVNVVKIVNGKFVNAMYLDSEEVTDRSIISLMESNCKNAVLNKKMEELYDNKAQAPNEKGICRGMWLYTTFSKKNSMKKSVLHSDVSEIIPADNFISGRGTCEVNAIHSGADVLRKDPKDENELQTSIQIRRVHTEENNNQLNNNGVNGTPSMVDNTVEIRKIEFKNRQIIGVCNDEAAVDGENEIASKNIGISPVKKVANNFGSVEESISQTMKVPEVMKNVAMKSKPLSNSYSLMLKYDNEGDELVDVVTPCNTSSLFREIQLIMNRKETKRKPQKKPDISSHRRFVPIAPRIDRFNILQHPVLQRPNPVLQAGPIRNMNGTAILSLGKTVVSIKLVPSIPGVGYITAAMYHNKCVVLKNPFTHLDDQSFFQNLETATRWLTDQLKRKVEFIPEDLKLVWRVKHATVNIKTCLPFDKRILDGSYYITEKGVFKAKPRDSIVHASNEKYRRKELLQGFYRLGSTFLSDEELRQTNKRDILKLAIKEIRKIHTTNTKLLLELSRLRKSKINSVARLYHVLRAIPSNQVRKREVAKLKQIYENYGDSIPVIDIDDAIADDIKEGSFIKARKTRKYLPDFPIGTACKQERVTSDESDSDDYLTDEDEVKQSSISRPLRLTDETDDSVSVSISVVRGDEPEVVQEPKDNDVTVTRILHGNNKVKSPKASFASSSSDKKLLTNMSKEKTELTVNIRDNIECKFSFKVRQNNSGSFSPLSSTLQVTPLKEKESGSGKKSDITDKEEGFLDLFEKDYDDNITIENSGMSSPSFESSDESKGFRGFPCKQEKEVGETQPKTKFQDVIVKKFQDVIVKKLESNNAIPIQTEGLIVKVDNDQSKTSSSVDANSSPPNQDINSLFQNLQRLTVKRPLQGSSTSGQFILTNSDNNQECIAPKKIRLVGVSKDVHQKTLNIVNLQDKSITAKKSLSTIPTLVGISKSPNTSESNPVTLSAIKNKMFGGKNSDVKYVVYDNSKSKIVSTIAPSSGVPVKYHLVPNSQGVVNRNVVNSCSTALPKTSGSQEPPPPLYVTIVSAAPGSTTKTTSTTNLQTLKTLIPSSQPLVNSALQTKQIIPQILSNVGMKPGATSSGAKIQLIHPLSGKTVRLSGNKVVSVSKSGQGNNSTQFVLCKGQQRFPLVVSAQQSLVNKNKPSSIGVGKNGNYVMASSTNSDLNSISATQTIKLRRLSNGVCVPVTSGNLSKGTSDIKTNTLVTTSGTGYPKLGITTHTTYTKSTAQSCLQPGLVNMTQNKPIVSIQSTNSKIAKIVSPGLIPLTAKKIDSTQLGYLKKGSTLCFRPIRPKYSVSQIIEDDILPESKANLPSMITTKTLLKIDTTNLVGESVSGIMRAKKIVSGASNNNNDDSESKTEVTGSTVTNYSCKDNGTGSEESQQAAKERESQQDVKSTNAVTQSENEQKATSSDEGSESDEPLSKCIERLGGDLSHWTGIGKVSEKSVLSSLKRTSVISQKSKTKTKVSRTAVKKVKKQSSKKTKVKRTVTMVTRSSIKKK
ncbi:uncharacterized protein [Periplaneta americana]|uniref:uncharacterized protein n=1 Tax=Periplaneta americana TaxID=6978 RepID=UPI0037E81B88